MPPARRQPPPCAPPSAQTFPSFILLMHWEPIAPDAFNSVVPFPVQGMPILAASALVRGLSPPDAFPFLSRSLVGQVLPGLLPSDTHSSCPHRIFQGKRCSFSCRLNLTTRLSLVSADHPPLSLTGCHRTPSVLDLYRSRDLYRIGTPQPNPQLDLNLT